MTEESAKTILDSLLPKSYELNDILWGDGLEVEDDSDGNVRYRKVKSGQYASVDDVYAAMGEVFSSEYVKSVKSSGIFTGNPDLGINPRYMMINGTLKRNIDYPVIDGFSEKNGKIDTSSVQIKKQNSHSALLLLKYTDGGEKELTLVLENGKWLINSPTY